MHVQLYVLLVTCAGAQPWSVCDSCALGLRTMHTPHTVCVIRLYEGVHGPDTVLTIEAGYVTEYTDVAVVHTD